MFGSSSEASLKRTSSAQSLRRSASGASCCSNHSASAECLRKQVDFDIDEALAQVAQGRHAPPAWVAQVMRQQETHYKKLVSAAQDEAQYARSQTRALQTRVEEAEHALTAPGIALQQLDERYNRADYLRSHAQDEAFALRQALYSTEAALRDAEARNAKGSEEVRWLRGELEASAVREKAAQESGEEVRQHAAWLQSELVAAEDALAKAQNENRRLSRQLDLTRREADSAEGWKQRKELLAQVCADLRTRDTR